MSSIDVYILGQKYTVKGDAPEEHIQKSQPLSMQR